MDRQKISRILTLLFYLLAIGTILAYFLVPDKQVMLYIGFSAIGVRLLTYLLRYLM